VVFDAHAGYRTFRRKSQGGRRIRRFPFDYRLKSAIQPAAIGEGNMSATATLTLTARRRGEIVLRRVFDAPRRLVFNALTLPQMLGYWFGPADATLAVCEVELRRGGTFRYVWRTADGGELRLIGTFLEVTAPERIVAVERFELGDEAAEFVSTTELEEADGLTRLTRTSRYAAPGTTHGCRGPVGRGATIGYDRLGQLFDPRPACDR
jgi:uncharacterized protein YndB with AHSA1/START domain